MLEKQLENLFRDWYLENCSDTVLVGQQVHVPTGIIDLLYFNTRWAFPTVVELKIGKAPKSVLAQIYSYMWQIQSKIDDRQYPIYSSVRRYEFSGKVRGIIVAETLDKRTMDVVAYSDEVQFIKYNLNGNKLSFDRYPFYLYEKPKGHEDPSIAEIVSVTKKRIIKDQLDEEQRRVLNVGGNTGLYLDKDLEVDFNIVWERREKDERLQD